MATEDGFLSTDDDDDGRSGDDAQMGDDAADDDANDPSAWFDADEGEEEDGEGEGEDGDEEGDQHYDDICNGEDGGAEEEVEEDADMEDAAAAAPASSSTGEGPSHHQTEAEPLNRLPKLPEGKEYQVQQRRVVLYMLHLAERIALGETPPTKGLCVYHPMGSGKTILALAVAKALHTHHHIHAVCLMVPNSTLGNWRRLLRLMNMPVLGDDVKYNDRKYVHLVTQTTGLGFFTRLQLLLSAAPGSEDFAKGQALARRFRKRKMLVIVDEAHVMRTDVADKPPKAKPDKVMAQKAKKMLAACHVAHMVLLLTGTPVVNEVADLRNMLAAVRGMTWDQALEAYRWPPGLKLPSLEQMRSWAKRAPHLYKNSFSVHSASSADACMPEVVNVPAEITMPPEYQVWYEEVEKKERSVRRTSKPSAAFLTQVRCAANCKDQESDDDDNEEQELLHKWADLPDDGDIAEVEDKTYQEIKNDPARKASALKYFGPKVSYLDENLPRWLMREVEKDGTEFKPKVVIFSTWMSFGLLMIKSLLFKHGLMREYGIIHGGISNARRDEHIKRFNSNHKRVLIFSRAGAEGMDLKGVTHMVILEPQWNPAMMEQIVGRACRYQSHTHLLEHRQKVFVHTVILKKGVLPPKSPPPGHAAAGGSASANARARAPRQPKGMSVDEYLMDIIQRKRHWRDAQFNPVAWEWSIEYEEPPAAPEEPMRTKVVEEVPYEQLRARRERPRSKVPVELP